MHILIDPSFFLTNNTGAPYGDELGRIKPLSRSSNSNDAILYGALEIGLVLDTYSIPNSTSLCGGNPD
jgi:hypothetical protein